MLVLCVCSCKSYPDVGREVTRLATGFRFTEGPAVAPNGDIYFSDIPNERIHIWSANGGLSTFRENSGRANGLLFDALGNLGVCEGGNRRVTLTMPDGEIKVLADDYAGKKFNSPNDLWIDPEGGVYFTDPRYGKNRNDMEQDGEDVYYLLPGGEKVIRVIDDLVRPNGIIGTLKGETLYVADRGAQKTYTYKVNDDGTLSDKKLFIEEGSDGMALDSRGNLYITIDVVAVYSPEGKLLKKITVPETPSNVCFGKDGKTLFITARKSFYAVRLDI
jgi:gluconolactonase